MTGLELKRRLNRMFGDDDDLIKEKLRNLPNFKKLFEKRSISVSDLLDVSERLNLPISLLLEKVDNEIRGDIWVNELPFRLPLYKADINFTMKEGEELAYFVAVFIDESNYIKVFSPKNIYEFNNFEKGDYVYFFFRTKKTCEIRHINKNRDINIEFIGTDGYRIYVDDRLDFHIKLYQNNDCIADEKVNSLINFDTMLVKIFEKYLDCINN